MILPTLNVASLTVCILPALASTLDWLIVCISCMLVCGAAYNQYLAKNCETPSRTNPTLSLAMRQVRNEPPGHPETQTADVLPEATFELGKNTTADGIF